MDIHLPGYTISPVPATAAAAREIWNVEADSGDPEMPHPIMALLWPAKNQDSGQKENQEPAGNDEHGHQYELDALLGPNNFFQWAAETSTNRIVAYVWWQHHVGKTEEEWAETYRNRRRTPRMNKALMDATSGERFLRRAKILGDQDCMSKAQIF